MQPATGSRPRPRPSWVAGGGGRVVAVLLAAVLALSACDPTATAEVPAGEVDVRVGAGPEAESQLLAAVAAGLVERAGGTAELVVLADAAAARRALELGDVDVLPAYTGEAWLEVLNRADPPADRATSLARVREADEQDELLWLSPPISRGATPIDVPPADATFAFVVTGAGPTADVVAMSQLATLLGQVTAPTLCVEEGFAQRPDGLQAVVDAYSIQAEVEVLAVDPADAVAGVVAGECLAGLTTATDGSAWRAGLRPLVDDLGVFPAFVVTFVVDEGLLEDRAPLVAGLRPLVANLTTARLGGWNARVAAGEPVPTVAADVVVELVGPAPSPSPAP